jgi:hypothetical protein
MRFPAPWRLLRRSRRGNLRLEPRPEHGTRVEPRGFEPLTSAVQSQIHNVVAVRWCSEIAAKWRILSDNVSCPFAVVRMGWCTTGVHERWGSSLL